ncbi:MAG: hypothetical protein JJE52_17695 [Acidimicrobiia bacterium]|nr:hypothetical protein [Acidimicrobiia bacterium]
MPAGNPSIAPPPGYGLIGPRHQLGRRLPRLVAGLVLCGVGIALTVNADLGLGPWDVLHQGISKLTGVPIGTVGILVGAVLLISWIPLRERPGIGTITNVILIGATVDIVLLWLPQPDHLAARVAFLVVGVFLFGPGSGLYIGAGLGPGPRDGLMTSIARRGPTVRLVRTLIELTALALGVVLGGTVGAGTVLFALTIGPNVQFFLPIFAVDRHPPPTAAEIG